MAGGSGGGSGGIATPCSVDKGYVIGRPYIIDCSLWLRFGESGPDTPKRVRELERDGLKRVSYVVAFDSGGGGGGTSWVAPTWVVPTHPSWAPAMLKEQLQKIGLTTEDPLVSIAFYPFPPVSIVAKPGKPLTFFGGAGRAEGDAGTVTIRVFHAPTARGRPVETLTVGVRTTSSYFAASNELAPGVYTAQVAQRHGDSYGYAETTFTVPPR